VKTLEGKKQEGFSYLKKITAVDHGASLEAVYIIYNPTSHAEEIVKVQLDPAKPVVETVMNVYAAADWNERELAEMFGIQIKGRKVKRLLLEKWNGVDAPLRKTFIWGDKNYRKI
jgi:NADH-quinone oxidoreductase subunit C